MKHHYRSAWITFATLVSLFVFSPAQAQDPSTAALKTSLDSEASRPIAESLEGFPELPRIIELPLEGDRPIFVRGDLVLLDSGQENPLYSQKISRPSIERTIRNFDELGCSVWLNSALDRTPLYTNTISEGLQQAHVVVIGTVTGRLQGFRGTLPGTAVRFEIDEVLKGRFIGTERFFFFPIADFQAGPYRVCIQSQTYPPLPKLGSQILVLLKEGPFIESPFWGQGATTAVTFSNGKAILPTHFRKAEKHPLSQDEFLSQVRAELEESR